MQSTITRRVYKMPDKPIKSEKIKVNKPYLKWFSIGFSVVLIEFIAIGSAYFIVESKNKSQQAALSDLVAKISQQNTYISELQNLPSVISSNAQRISDTEGNLRLVTENFNELKNEVGNHKVDLLAQQFNLLTHKLETLEETKNQEVLALSVALIIKENALYHRSFADEADILTQMTKDQPLVATAVQTISNLKTSYISDDLQLAEQFREIAKNLNFENNKNDIASDDKNEPEGTMAKSIALIKDTVAGLNFDKVVVVKKNIQNDEQVALIDKVTKLVDRHDFANALDIIKSSPDFQKLNSEDLNQWVQDVEKKISFDEALSVIISSELSALRQDLSQAQGSDIQ